MRSGLCLWLLLALGCARDNGPAGPVTLGAGLQSPDAREEGAVLQDLDPEGPAIQAASTRRPADPARARALYQRACKGGYEEACTRAR